MKKTKDKQLKLMLVKSLNGRLKNHIACARGLWLRHIRQTSIVEDTPSNRGMANKISYLLKIEEC